MKPDLVLDEDDKKKRFKKYKTPDDEAAHSGIPNDDPNVDNNYFGSSEAENKINKRQLGQATTPQKKHQKKKSSSTEKDTSILDFPLPPFKSEYDEDDDESRKEEDFLEFVRETAGVDNVQKILSDLAENESFIDPETGMLMNSGKSIFVC